MAAEVESLDKCTVAQIKKVLRLLYKDFIVGKISSDGIAVICNQLFDAAAKHIDEDPELFEAVNLGSELGYYIRGNRKLRELFIGFLEKFEDYSK